MNRVKGALIPTAFVLAAVVAPPGKAQVKTQKDQNKATLSPGQDAQKKNIQEYISLLRSNVRQQKAEIMGVMMSLSTQDATKFWPIYSAHGAQLAKLNDQRAENIKEDAAPATK
jgi:hypothetical protein